MLLLGPNVLVTRPQHYQASLINILKQNGMFPIALPVIELSPSTKQEKIISRLKQLDQFWGVIFVSQAAVRYTFDTIHSIWPRLPTIEWFSIGATTALRLKEQGVQHVHVTKVPPFNSEALLQYLDQYLEKKSIDGNKILIICGDTTRNLLPTALAEKCSKVVCLEVYKRTTPKKARKEAEKIFSMVSIDFMVTTSAEGLSNLWDLIPMSYQSMALKIPIMVVGKKALLFAKKKRFEFILESLGAEDNVILDTILSSGLLRWKRGGCDQKSTIECKKFRGYGKKNKN